MPKNEEDPETLLPEIRNVKLSPDPQEAAKKAAASLLDNANLLKGKRAAAVRLDQAELSGHRG